MERIETSRIMLVLAAAYPNWKVTDEMMGVYHQLLGDLDGATVAQATKRWAMTEKWPPTVADIRQLCADMMGALSPAPEDAWAEVMRVARVYGSTMQIPPWSHPAIEQAVNSIGYREICMSDRVDVLRAHFTKTYEGYRSRVNQQVLTSPALAVGNQAISLGSILKQVELDK